MQNSDPFQNAVRNTTQPHHQDTTAVCVSGMISLGSRSYVSVGFGSYLNFYVLGCIRYYDEIKALENFLCQKGIYINYNRYLTRDTVFQTNLFSISL